ncbi:hypothetical protein OG417_46990 [Actinoallomurus sp. NBC_01490]|jgi:hypothetical protein|uniref:hypothetical protein n=1 Tax=Actinoallomurus sp. NBC_01490 TaxID=2903557 RepID=UPI002E3338EB|nr:hypothetical protein [Actinoallomurus sp. NBC_01490]
MPHVDNSGPKYPWGNDDWPGLQPKAGQNQKDWNKQANYNKEKLDTILGNLRSAHDALLKAIDHLPKAKDGGAGIDAAKFGPPTGQRLAGDAQQASDHLRNGFTAFLGAWADLITKVDHTASKHYSTEDDNKHRVQQTNDWK